MWWPVLSFLFSQRLIGPEEEALAEAAAAATARAAGAAEIAREAADAAIAKEDAGAAAPSAADPRRTTTSRRGCP